MSISGDSWYVKLSDGDVHRVTLDQLDEAFQAGHIDGDTMVLASGATQWTKLGALAGIDDDGEIEAEISAPAIPAQSEPRHVASPGYGGRAAGTGPQTFGAAATMPANHGAWPAPSAPLGTIPQAASAPAAGAPAFAPSFNGARPTYGVQSPQIRPMQLNSPGVPAGAAPWSPPLTAARAPLPNSLRPVSLDFEDVGSDAFKLRRGSGKRWFAALLVLSVLGGAGFVAVRRPSWAQPYLNRIAFLRGSSESTAVATAPPVVPVVPPPAPPATAVAPPTPEPVPPAPATAAAAGDLNPHFTDRTDRLTDDQKLRLADADKQKSKGHKNRATAGTSHHAGPAASKKPTTFTTGGNKFDPLNSSI